MCIIVVSMTSGLRGSEIFFDPLILLSCKTVSENEWLEVRHTLRTALIYFILFLALCSDRLWPLAAIQSFN